MYNQRLFKVGEMFKWMHTSKEVSVETITHVVLEETEIEAPWIDGDKVAVVPANSYVLIDNLGRASYIDMDYVHNCYESGLFEKIVPENSRVNQDKF